MGLFESKNLVQFFDVFDLKYVENSKIYMFLNYFLLVHNDTKLVLFPSFKPIESG